MIDRWQGDWSRESELQWAIADSDSSMIGRVAVTHLDLHDGLGELTYWTVPRVRGRGLATSAVAALVDSEWRLPSLGAADVG